MLNELKVPLSSLPLLSASPCFFFSSSYGILFSFSFSELNRIKWYQSHPSCGHGRITIGDSRLKKLYCDWTSQLYSAMEGPETRCPPQSDPLTELICLEQIGNVQHYFDSFKLLLSRVEISEDLAIEVFLRGLEPEIQTLVRSFKPSDLYVAYSLARLKESTLSVLGVKEDVIVDGIGAGTCGAAVLEFVGEEPENADASQMFDEMSVKETIVGDSSVEDGEEPIDLKILSNDFKWITEDPACLIEPSIEMNSSLCISKELELTDDQLLGKRGVDYELEGRYTDLSGEKERLFKLEVEMSQFAMVAETLLIGEGMWNSIYVEELVSEYEGSYQEPTRPGPVKSRHYRYPSLHKCNLRLGLVDPDADASKDVSDHLIQLFLAEP